MHRQEYVGYSRTITWFGGIN